MFVLNWLPQTSEIISALISQIRDVCTQTEEINVQLIYAANLQS